MRSIPVKYEFYLILALLFISATLVIWIRTATVKATYLYVQQERELRRVQDALQAERVRWLKLTSPKRLDQLAAIHDLHPPKIDQVMKYGSLSK